MQGFPGAGAAVLRERIERDVDVCIFGEMLLARTCPEADHTVRADALFDETRDQAIAKAGIVKRIVLDDELRSRSSD